MKALKAISKGKEKNEDIMKFSLNAIVDKISCGNKHILFLSNGSVFALGSNEFGQLGINGNLSAVNDPVWVKLLWDVEIVDIASSNNYSIACDEKGRCFIWGWSSFINSPVPKVLEELTYVKIVRVYAGLSHCGFLTDEGEVYMMGLNNYG